MYRIDNLSNLKRNRYKIMKINKILFINYPSFKKFVISNKNQVAFKIYTKHFLLGSIVHILISFNPMLFSESNSFTGNNISNILLNNELLKVESQICFVTSLLQFRKLKF